MSGMKEVLKDAVLLVLPSLSPDVTNQLVEKLMDQGVEGLDDLVYVLPSVPPETNTTLGSPPSSFSRPTSSSLASASVTHSWTENFQVPWNLMPDGIKSAVENGQRPSPSDRRQMIRILAHEMRKHDKNPTRSQCLTVSRKIVSQYPKSFADMLGDKQVGGGYESVLSQLKVRIEHLNRTNTLSHHRIQRSDSGTTRKRSSTDSYGCTRWQPDLPPRETYDSLEMKSQKMEEMHLHEGISGAERGDVCKLMEETYWLQRHMINATPSPTIADIKIKWPYLFTQRHIYGHFEQLTDKKVLRCLELSIQECGQIIIEFFKSKPTNDDIRSILSRGENDVDAMVIQLLLAHFKEKLDGVFLQADEFATPSDVQHSLNLPESPRLIFLALSNQRWMLSLEGQVVCEGAQPNFITGLAALFASFYNFNLQYQEEAACTLEFVQK
ncbi:uncharacterized protein LOC127983555 [Carassius gibelio]|uniref:uncharacterized protein LOC127983555 n=1 Tax=Carassius gibelio TaxID=101364 RepID=UPI002277FE65|nr:uncharacterized protein LOC127983555 [Carassius gibelio]